jgi:hypothetical protein
MAKYLGKEVATHRYEPLSARHATDIDTFPNFFVHYLKGEAMKRSDAFPSQYMTTDDVKTAAKKLTIMRVEMREIDSGNKAESKPVAFFKEPGTKPLILNNTNWIAIEAAYGGESDNWTGKEIVAYFDPHVSYGGKQTGGIRVRMPRVPATAPVAPPPAMPEEEEAY